MTLPTFTRAEFRDAGHGVAVREVYRDGEIYAIEYTHPGECARRSEGDFVPVAREQNAQDWKLESENPLTLSPSLLCRTCGHHGFIREGKWVPA